MDIQLLIGGHAQAAESGATFERSQPISGEVVTTASAATPGDALKAADSAAAAFSQWSAIGPNARRDALLEAARRLEQNTAEFTHRMSCETGATAGWSGFNVFLGARMLREAASLTTQITGETIPSDKPGCLSLAIRQPAGVVLGIAPWNAPVILGVRALAMPLACGNSVVLKASEICPATHHLIGEILSSVLPVGTVNVVTNAPADAGAVVTALISHPAIRRVNFTGSTAVGRIIAETAGRHLKPVLLELGGKAPLIVLDDADLDAAVAAAAFGAFMNQGQICMSTELIIVDERVAKDFVGKFKAKAEKLTAGDPRTGEFALGGLVSSEAAKRVKALIDDAASKGASIVLDGVLESVAEGTILSPAIVDQVTPAMRIYSEESFGPVAAIVRVRGDEEALRVANASEYGLAAAVFSQNINRAISVASRIRAGICHINGPTVQDEAQMPFGGLNASGYGRFGGRAAIAEFTDLKWVTIETGPQHYPI